MSRPRQLAAGAMLLGLLAGCSNGSPAADLQTRLNAMVDAANSRDAAALRTAVGRFEELVAAQSQQGSMTATRSQALRTMAEQVLLDASLLDQPTPTPTPALTPTPTPSPSPTPSQTAPPTPPPSAAPPPSSPPPAPSPTASSAPASSPPPVVPGVTLSPSSAGARP